MTKYVDQIDTKFSLFRLDNTHSKPIFIAEYLAGKIKEFNPDLIIIN